MPRGTTKRAAASSASPIPAKRARGLSPINDLPDELLASIFHKLEWRERLKMEAVCRRWSDVAKRWGWNDVNGFTIDAQQSTRATSTALERCGNRLQWLNVLRTPSKAQLQLCPNIRHFRLTTDSFPASLPCRSATYEGQLETLAALEELYGSRIKSLSLHQMEFGWNRLHASFYAFLDAIAGSLEYLCLRGYFEQATQFPSQLRCLQLKPYKTSTSMPENVVRFLSQLENGQRFAQLHSLELAVSGVTQLSLLQHLPQLVHLTLHMRSVRVHARTVNLRRPMPQIPGVAETSLIEVLPHLGNLKSLVVAGGSPSLIAAVARECPQLEHLGWREWNFTVDIQSDMHRVVALNEVGQRLQNLRSLEVTDFHQLNDGWEWLESILGRGRLEYLNLKMIPADMLYKAIRKNPKLRMISTVSRYPAERIVAAAVEAGSPTSGESLPILYCYCDVIDPEQAKKHRGRFVFIDRLGQKPPKSHVLRQYRYGCFGEGKPKWKKIK